MNDKGWHDWSQNETTEKIRDIWTASLADDTGFYTVYETSR